MDEKIGPALRQARIGQHRTLRSVAQATGISASLLSQVETGKSQPSVSTLYSLVNHLGISLDELLGLTVTAQPRAKPAAGNSVAPPPTPHPAAMIQRAAENPVLDMDNGVRWERLAVNDTGLVEPLLVTYQPGASSSVEGGLMRHNGIEYAFLIDGELTLQLEFDRHVLRAGDSFCFDSVRPHLYVNHTSSPARGLWFVFGRHSLDHTREQVAELLTGLRRPGPAPTNAVEALELLDATRPAVREQH